jgi:hypothetical protein
LSFCHTSVPNLKTTPAGANWQIVDGCDAQLRQHGQAPSWLQLALFVKPLAWIYWKKGKNDPEGQFGAVRPHSLDVCQNRNSSPQNARGHHIIV